MQEPLSFKDPIAYPIVFKKRQSGHIMYGQSVYPITFGFNPRPRHSDLAVLAANVKGTLFVDRDIGNDPSVGQFSEDTTHRFELFLDSPYVETFNPFIQINIVGQSPHILKPENIAHIKQQESKIDVSHIFSMEPSTQLLNPVSGLYPTASLKLYFSSILRNNSHEFIEIELHDKVQTPVLLKPALASGILDIVAELKLNWYEDALLTIPYELTPPAVRNDRFGIRFYITDFGLFSNKVQITDSGLAIVNDVPPQSYLDNIGFPAIEVAYFGKGTRPNDLFCGTESGIEIDDSGLPIQFGQVAATYLLSNQLEDIESSSMSSINSSSTSSENSKSTSSETKTSVSSLSSINSSSSSSNSSSSSSSSSASSSSSSSSNSSNSSSSSLSSSSSRSSLSSSSSLSSINSSSSNSSSSDSSTSKSSGSSSSSQSTINSSSSSSSYSSSSSVHAHYFVNFEDVTKITYPAALRTLNGVEWMLDEAVIGTSASDKKNGLKSLRLRGSTSLQALAEMRADKPDGLGTLSFYYSRYSTNTLQPNLYIEYSTDSGSNWTTISTISPPFPTDLTLWSSPVNIDGNVRIRFRTDLTGGGTSSRMINIDDILFTEGNPPPQYICVSGAGLSAFNGTYEYDGTGIYYIVPGSGYEVGKHLDNTWWFDGAYSPDGDYYHSTTAGGSPVGLTFTTNSLDLGTPPTISIGPCP